MRPSRHGGVSFGAACARLSADVALAACALCVPIAALDARAAEWVEGLKSAFASEAEARGDLGALSEEWLTALERYADTPLAPVLLLRMGSLCPPDVEPRGATGVYERLLARDLNGHVREGLTDRLAARYRAAGEFGHAEGVESAMGYIRSWAVIGPFGYTTWSVHDQQFPPEHAVDFGRAERSGLRTVGWRLHEGRTSGRRVDVFLPLWPQEGCAYAVAQVRSDEKREALLILACQGSHKVWWNGRLAADVDRGREHLSGGHAWRVTLEEGWNRLMLKVTAGGPVVTCRLADERARPMAGLEREGKLTLHTLTASGPAGEAVPYGYLAAREEMAKLLDGPYLDKGLAPLVCAAKGLLESADGRAEESLASFETAVELAPGSPHLWCQLALAAEGAGVLPPSLRRTRAREAFEKAAACDGGFVPAERRIAERMRSDNKPEQAIARLRAAAGRSPDNPQILLDMAAIALGEGWLNEARTWAQDAEKADPRCRRTYLFWALFHSRRGNVPLAAAAYRRALAIDRSDAAASEALAGILASRGDTAEALAELGKRLEASPDDLGAYATSARVELEAGRYRHAAQTVRAALGLCPGSPRLNRMLGEIYLRQGDTQKALESWNTALGSDPGWVELRRETLALRREVMPEGRQAAGPAGEDLSDDFSRPYAIDVKRSIAESGSAEDYPHADTILVLDQTVIVIHEDGSYSEITHQARKALTTEGAEDLSEVRVRGEIMEARTHGPDGTVREPAVLPGRKTLTMPGVEIGSVVEYKYRDERRAPKGGFVDLPHWSFASLGIPHQFSDYVVISPATMKIETLVRNWHTSLPEESLRELPAVEEAGRVVRRWQSRNMRPLDPGAGHKNAIELVPNVKIARARTWDELDREMLDLFLGRTRPTAALRREARLAAGGAEGCEAVARAIFRHVNDLVKTDAELYDANHVLLARAGSRAILLAALLRAAGLDARFAAARPPAEAIAPSEGPGEPAWEFPQAGYFSDTLVCVLCPDGRKLWLDPSGPYSSFGAIAPRFGGGTAFILSPDGGVLTRLPRPTLEEQGETTRTELVVDPVADTIAGFTEIVFAGAVGAVYKERFAESGSLWQQNWAEERLSAVLSGASIEGLNLSGLEDPEAPFQVRIGLSLCEALAGGGEWRDVPEGLSPLGLVKLFVTMPERQYALKISSPVVRWDEVTIRLAGAAEAGEWAPPEDCVLQCAFGSYGLTFARRADGVHARRTVAILPQEVSAEGYDEFVKFCRGIDAAEAAPLRLRLPARAAE